MKIKEIVVDIEYDTDSDPMERRKGKIIIPDPGIASDVVMCIRVHMGDALKKLSSRRVFHRDKPYPGSLRDMLTRHGWQVKPRKPGDLLSGLKYRCPDCKKWMLYTEMETHLAKCGRGTPCSVEGCCVEREGTKKKKRVKQDPYLEGIDRRSREHKKISLGRRGK